MRDNNCDLCRQLTSGACRIHNRMDWLFKFIIRLFDRKFRTHDAGFRR